MPFRLPVFEQGRNPVESYIPVARITELQTEHATEFARSGRDVDACCRVEKLREPAPIRP